MDFDKAWQTVFAVILAIAGGLARLLNLKSKTKLNWSRIISELFISGFAGLMVLMLARASGLSGDMVGVVAGISGWVGARVLEVVAKAVSKATGINIGKEKDD